MQTIRSPHNTVINRLHILVPEEEKIFQANYDIISGRAKQAVQNEAKLLNPKKGLTTGTKVRIRYLPGQADCAVLDPRSTVA